MKNKKKKIKLAKKINNIPNKNKIVNISYSEKINNNKTNIIINNSSKESKSLKNYKSINKNKKDFIKEIEELKQRQHISEHSYLYLKELIKKLSNEDRTLDIAEKKMIELEISNLKLLDWQKNRFEASKGYLKEKTKKKISVLFEDFDDYMWKGELVSFSELRGLSRILAKKI